MRKLPEDFRINILLPGAVWLLVSTLIGRVAVARMETDTITVILFVVITLVVFAIPMAVYMEYRRKIEECVSRHKPGHTWARRGLPEGGRRNGCLVTAGRLTAGLSRRAERRENPRFIGCLAPGGVSGRGIPPMQGLQRHADGFHSRQHR